MEDVSVLNNARITGYKTNGAKARTNNRSERVTGFSESVATLISEGGLNFFRYLKKRGMSGETDLIVLSSKSHYFYDENDLKRVRVLVNLRKLNVIKHLDMFLNTLVRILPPETSFVGYFSDNNAPVRNDLVSLFSRIYGRLINLMDGKTDRVMNTNDVRGLLERNGFEVMNMTTISGQTYFHSHCVQRPVELKAS
ncbi:MAG: hypothetical protein WAL94_05890 [Bacteroidales bacterium]